MKLKVLFVDDDQNILSAYMRNFRGSYAIETAPGGAQALASLETKGPFAVVVADMRMDGMDGIGFLKRVYALCPDTVRIMLTGKADLGTAQNAVNQGHIFRFLTKPCPQEVLSSALDEGIRQFELAQTERELLEQTLTGATKALTEMLSLADPVAFGLAARAADLAEEVGRRMGLKETWSLRIATMLAPIGLVTLPPSVLLRHRGGEPLEPKERDLLLEIPGIGARLVASIPRLEEVAHIIYFQGKHYDGSGFPAGDTREAGIPIQARILKAVMDFVCLQCQRHSPAMALEQLECRLGYYDPEILRTIGELFQGDVENGSEAPQVHEIDLGELRVGQILASAVETMEGATVLPTGTPISFSHLEKVQNYARLTGVQEPIRIFEIW